jgi:hypothetical protein
MADRDVDVSPVLSGAGWRALAADSSTDAMRRVAELAAQIADLMEQPIGLATLHVLRGSDRPPGETP